MEGKRLVCVKEEVEFFVKGDGPGCRQGQSFRRTNHGQLRFNGFRRDLVGEFATQTEQNGAIGSVAMAGESEGSVKIGFDTSGFGEQAGVAEARRARPPR